MVFVGKQKPPKNGETTFMCNTNGQTECRMYYDGHWFIGNAKCLEQDNDFWSERTGCTIAELKANIKRLRYIRKQKREELKPLIHFQKRLECCKEYDSESFEARRLRKEIYLYNEQINELTNAIADEENYLKKYITDKENLYNKLRAKKGSN